MEAIKDLGSFFRFLGVIVAWIVSRKLMNWYFKSESINPFAEDDRKPRKPYVVDHKLRDSIIKQSFHFNKVPEGLDAIVIGSGFGGLCTASILAKAGKKVLVLEQDEKAGGYCRTYSDKGYEFDAGFHYFGDMGNSTLIEVLIGQIGDGQIEWGPLGDAFDCVSIGYGKENRRYPICGNERLKATLKNHFQDEEEAIDKYFRLLKMQRGTEFIKIIVKVLPLWICRILIKSRLLNLMTKLWKQPLKSSTKEVIEGLTKNKDLQTVFCYNWGDCGVPPTEYEFSEQAHLMNRSMRGEYYPVGGVSELARSVIPVIERSGGRVLVGVKVQEILTENGRAMGVKVRNGSETYMIYCGTIVSDAGLHNTFCDLLPSQVASKSYYHEISKNLEPAMSSIYVFVGFNKSNEELGLKRQNLWAFAGSDLGLDFEVKTSKDVPPMFVTFPSAKDPNWKSHPDRKKKATMVVVSFANLRMYKEHEDSTQNDGYDDLVNAMGQKMIQRCCELFPNIKDHIDYVDTCPQATKSHEQYVNVGGSDALTCAKLRPKTDIEGLYLTGTDVFNLGFDGASIGGLLAASQILDRNLVKDLQLLQQKFINADKKSQ